MKTFFSGKRTFFSHMKRAAGVAGVKLSSARDSLRDSETRLEIRVAVVAFCLGCLEFWESQGFRLLNHQSGNKIAKYLVGLTTILA